MRTKTIVLSALCGVIGSAAAMAQSVYSVNAVGYVNVTCPPGFSIIANPLSASTNKLSALIPNPPEGTAVYEYANGNFQIATYAQDDFGVLNWDNDLVFEPGTGAWISNPASTNLVLTFVGEVKQGALSNPVPTGFSLKGSMVPQAGSLQSLGYVPTEGDAIYMFRNKNFYICTYAQDDFGNLNWDNPPDVNVAEGFWILTSATNKTWDRNFSVNNN